ncbi:MAG: TrkA family potassium uptake protein [Erysipelotrichaceae bacterium]|nr:TrkA family potassium uptake protein [Erysipelotrichaceae bacterium]MBR3151453.1 TrkA family potassium uptake protein [Erysipelotrichaceae bacterium]MBR3167426.1 TrkA family potassium uptake protein [Erysipelotrichaceae bacterium]
MKSVLVIGAGRYGSYICKKLYEMGHQIMVVDQDEERINKILPFVTGAQIGDSTNRVFMESLGIPDYDLCIVAIGDNFLSSLETTFLLDELGAPKIVSRATTSSQEKFLLRNGADEVVFPERQMGNWTAIRFISDNISNYIELTDGYSIYEVYVPAAWDNKRIGEIDIRRKYKINILGVKNGTMNMDISNDTLLHRGQTMLVLGKTQVIQKLFGL